MLDDNSLKKMYESMSIAEIAISIGRSPSTVYRRLLKLDVAIRSKSDAQKLNITKNGNKRIGKKHSLETKEKISEQSSKFWSTEDGEIAKESIKKSFRERYENKSVSEKREISNRLASGKKKHNEPSSIAILMESVFASFGENVSVKHDEIDVIFPDRKIGICVIPVMSAHKQYNKLVEETIDGYTVIPYKTKCTNFSRAEAKRIIEIMKGIK